MRKTLEKLRPSDYTSLRDALADSGSLENQVNLFRAVKMVILPSTYTQSDRYMRQKLQGILSMSTKVGNPNIFLRRHVTQTGLRSIGSLKKDNQYRIAPISYHVFS